ncbi:MAG: hypothetical protein IT338_14510 [Thermomicrobiales bacterium]|nr:hypothetical protein [Thermomicrobiales bacterium]
MMITQPALLCLEATLQRVTGRISERVPEAALARDEAGRSAIPSDIDTRAPAAVARSASAPAELPAQPLDPEAPLTPNELRARAAALRALALSRGRRFEAARVAFAEAARLDPSLDLTRTPAFWTLERGAHEAAIEAYVVTGRDRDAAVLRARINSTFRPRPVKPRRPAAATP